MSVIERSSHWRADEIETLLKMRADGKSWVAISARLKRRINAVQGKDRELRAKARVQATETKNRS